MMLCLAIFFCTQQNKFVLVKLLIGIKGFIFFCFKFLIFFHVLKITRNTKIYIQNSVRGGIWYEVFKIKIKVWHHPNCYIDVFMYNTGPNYKFC